MRLQKHAYPEQNIIFLKHHWRPDCSPVPGNARENSFRKIGVRKETYRGGE
jgi:hypothetical protein